MTDRTHYCAGCKARQDHIEKLEADNARLRGLLREAEVKLTDVQGAYATKRYADNLLARIRAALQETSHDA